MENKVVKTSGFSRSRVSSHALSRELLMPLDEDFIDILFFIDAFVKGVYWPLFLLRTTTGYFWMVK